MKKLVIIIFVLALAIAVTLLAKDDPGYVLVDIKGVTLETSLVFSIIVIGLVFLLAHYSLRFYGGVKSVGKDYRIWRKRRGANKANESLVKGLLELSEGKWQEAEKDVLKHVGKNQASLLNYLAAARAAQEQGAYERRDMYLRDAHQTMPSANITVDIAVGLTQAQLQLDQNQLEQALATLRHLQQLAPKHKQVLKTLTTLYVNLADWEHLVELLPNLRKRKIFSDDYIQNIEQQAYKQLLDQAAITGDAKTLQDLWYRVPQEVQQQESLTVCYITHLFNVGGSDITEPLIRNALKKYWSESLVRYYGLIDSADAKSQLNYAESWLSTHENNAVLLLTLGRLSLRNGLWGKARGYLEASIGAGKLPEAYNELGHLLEKIGEKEAAIQYYKLGLANAPGCEKTIAQSINAAELEHKPPTAHLLPKTSAAV